MAFLQSFFWFLVLIGVMILIHELGHFWAARWFDVRSKCLASALVPGSSVSGAATRTIDFRPFCSAATSKWPASNPAKTRRRSPRFARQTALAAADYRLRRSLYEHGPGCGSPDRSVHVQVPEAGGRQQRCGHRLCDAGLFGGKGRTETGDKIIRIERIKRIRAGKTST